MQKEHQAKSAQTEHIESHFDLIMCKEVHNAEEVTHTVCPIMHYCILGTSLRSGIGFAIC